MLGVGTDISRAPAFRPRSNNCLNSFLAAPLPLPLSLQSNPSSVPSSSHLRFLPRVFAQNHSSLRARFFRAQRASLLIGHLCTTSAIAIIAVGDGRGRDGAVAGSIGREALISLCLILCLSLQFCIASNFTFRDRARGADESWFSTHAPLLPSSHLCSIRPSKITRHPRIK